MATTVDINFAELIDLSLGTPEIVNYKGLRVLLSAIVTKLGVSSVNLELNEGDKIDLNAAREAMAKGEADDRLAHIPERPATGANHKDITVTDGMEKSKSSDDAAGLSSDGSTSKALQDIEDKVSRIEGQLNALNSLPSNQSLMARSGTNVDGNKTTPVSDMWQLMQVQKKAAANEEGVSKLMSMVEDIMRELRGVAGQLDDHSTNISDLKRKFAALDNKHGDLQKEIEKINEYNKTVESRLNKLEMSTGQQDKIDELHQLLDALRNQLASLPDVDSIVTWPAFEDALKGAYKEPIDYNDSSMQTAPIVDNTRMQTMPTTHASAQTTTPTPPPSRPVSSKSVRSAVSSVSSQQPTQELQRILKELGELTGRHNILEDRVNGLEELLAKKADMSEVEALLSQTNVPEDLANKLAELEEGLNNLRESREKDQDALEKLKSTIAQLRADVDKLNSSYVHLVDEHNVKQKHIDALYTFVDRLQENKADKEHVIMEIDVKADKRALDSKVSRSHFDGAVDELSKNLSDVMDKMTGHKVAWDSAVSELKLDIDNKLDRMELDPLKSYLDNRIKAVSAKMVRSKEVETGEDAAGFRRPLQKFHCISCDRPLDMTPQTPIASLPENKGLPANRSGRPYTTFELEQIRAAQKNSHFQDVPDYFVANRSCGGSHTLTYPHRRITRVSQLTNVVTTAEDITPVVNGRIEADIQGQDGHIYKARLDTGHMTERLPTLTQPRMSARAKSPRLGSARGRRSQPPTRQTTDVMDNAPVIPTGAVVPRPTSARVTQRPTSARPSSAKPPSSPSSGGRGSPMGAPANTVDAGEAGGTGGGPPPPPTPREPPLAPASDVTVPQPPQDQDQS